MRRTRRAADKHTVRARAGAGIRRVARGGLAIAIGLPGLAMTVAALPADPAGAGVAAILPGTSSSVRGDFNQDGFDDLAIGAPGEDLGNPTRVDAGAVTVIYGSGDGLSPTAVLPDEVWHQNSTDGSSNPVADKIEAGDHFGASVATGDFDGDGIDDLAVGVPGEDVGALNKTDAGAVNVLYGSTTGLTASDDFLYQSNFGVLETAEPGDNFGAALAAGDFDGDGVDDLAMGTPGEGGAIARYGAVNVSYGPLGSVGQLFHQDRSGIDDATEPDDHFASALAAGDFNGDGVDELAIGVPGEDIAVSDAGAVHVLPGVFSTGLTASGSQFWRQGVDGLQDTFEGGDEFGSALATGDFGGSVQPEDELAIGVPGEDSASGAVSVLSGTPSGLTATGNQLWRQSELGLFDSSEPGDRFGAALAAGDVGRTLQDDLLVGAPSEDLLFLSGPIDDAGVMDVIYGSGFGLSAANSQMWHQRSPGPVPDDAEPFDFFGSALATGDFNGDRGGDVAIGVPGEDLETATLLSDAGLVNVLYGGGLVATGPQQWHQNSPGVGEAAETGDGFGAALGAA